MSARTEQLLEEIKQLELNLVEGKLDAISTATTNTRLRHLRRELSTATEALTEGKQILKG